MSVEFLKSKYQHVISKIYESDNLEKLYSFTINFMDLLEFDSSLGNKLIENPVEVLKQIQDNVINIQNNMKMKAKGCTKNKISVRICKLPVVDDNQIDMFPESENTGSFIQLRGLVIKAYEGKYLEFKRCFACNKCETIIVTDANYDKHYVIELPKQCIADGCKSKTFKNLERYNPKNCRKYQEIKIQEIRSATGSIPGTLCVTLEDDFVDCCNPGDTIIVTGILSRRWSITPNGREYVPELALKANHLEVTNHNLYHLKDPYAYRNFKEFWLEYGDDLIKGRDIILRSIAPELNGMLAVKLAVALIIAGGCRNADKDIACNVRAESHLLLIGDPGMGKSQLLSFASKILPHSVFTTGLGTTSAGLTVTAIKENGEWQLKAGALVMADNGICCIDEFNLMKEHDRVNLHEAMEQQTISVAKANIVCKLNTRCSVIAASNNSRHKKMDFHSPLLSRFDLVVPIKDRFDPNLDSQIADHILNCDVLLSEEEEQQLWQIDKIKIYFEEIRKLQPVMTDEATELLSNYYKMQRQRGEKCEMGRKTVRMLESLIRLSQAHAKFLSKSTVDEIDANAVIDLMEACKFN